MRQVKAKVSFTVTVNVPDDKSLEECIDLSVSKYSKWIDYVEFPNDGGRMYETSLNVPIDAVIEFVEPPLKDGYYLIGKDAALYQRHTFKGAPVWDKVDSQGRWQLVRDLTAQTEDSRRSEMIYFGYGVRLGDRATHTA